MPINTSCLSTIWKNFVQNFHIVLFSYSFYLFWHGLISSYHHNRFRNLDFDFPKHAEDLDKVCLRILPFPGLAGCLEQETPSWVYT